MTSLDAAVARSEAGLPVDGAELPPRARRALALAGHLGARRAPALRAAAAAERDAEELASAVAVASAEGRSVARGLVLAPPVLGPATALLVTDDPFAVWHTPAGHAVLAVATVLWLAGWAGVRLLVRQATRGPARRDGGPDDELLDLVGVALAAGVGLPAAVRAAGAATGSDHGRVALWLELGCPGEPPTGWAPTAGVLAAAARDGVALAPLAHALAADRRRAAHRRALERAARLGARLTLPTTLLLLPAAVLLVAAPLLHGAVGLLG